MDKEQKKNSLKKYFRKLIKIIIALILLILKLNIFHLNKNEEYRVCLCTPAKKENLYIREFIEYYKKYGVDKIFLYDNNELNGEKFEDVINDYIKRGFVEIINYRGYHQIALKMMDDCYQKNKLNYDWLIFYEVDEYIYLKDYISVKDYLKNKRFSKCDRIQLNWILYTDNNLLYYDNRTLVERFNEKEKIERDFKLFNNKSIIKSIIRGNLSNVKIEHIHFLNKKIRGCDGFGNPKKVQGFLTDKGDYKYYYIKHFYCKSTEEFINKINKGDVYYYKKNMYGRVAFYFSYNLITLSKIELIENRTGLNLSKFREKIKKNNL